MSAWETSRLGEDGTLHNLETAGEQQEVALAMASQASEHIFIFSIDMDPAIFNTFEFAEAAARLAREKRQAEVHILVKDSRRAIKEGHRLIALAQRLSSKVQIRNPSHEYKDVNEPFMVVDGRGVLYRTLPDRFEGTANFNDPLKARELSELFVEMWERATGDPNTRRLGI